MSNPLKEFLKVHEVGKEQSFTHTSLSPYTNLGKYLINSKSDVFFKVYYEQVIEKGKMCYLSERHLEKFGKVCIDIDLRYDLSMYSERSYTVKLLKDLVQVYQDKFQEITGDTCSEQEMIAFVMEKAHPEVDEERGILKDGLHIMFPYLSISYKAQHWVRKQVLEQMRKHPELEICSNTIEKIVDDAVIERNNWLMYGSRKNKNAQTYVVTYMLDGDGDECDIPEMSVGFLKLLSIQLRTKEHPTILDKMEEESRKMEEKKRETQMAMNLSLLTDGLTTDEDMGRPKKSKEYLRAMLSLLGKHRVDDYNDWFIVGAVCCNEGEDNLDIWKEWSAQSSKYKEGHCEKLWETTFSNHMGERKVRIGTLQRFARDDSPERYFGVISKYEKEDELFALIKKAMRNTHSEFAELAHYLLKGRFMYSNEHWYCFEANRWRQLSSNIPLMKEITKEVRGVLINYETMLNKEILMKGDVEDNDRLLEEKTRLGATIKCLKNYSYKTAVVNECKEFFYNEEFYKELDMNIYLLGFSNGVYDLKNGIFRETRPEDRVSYTTGYDYTEKVIQPIRREIMQLFEQSLPQEDVREFMLMFLGSTLIGTNKNELFVNLEGSGGNGKGVITTLHDNALGDYAGTLDNAYLTNVSSSQEGHNSKMISVFKKRYVQVNEPPKGKYLNQDYIKELTGNDKLQIRKAHAPEPEVSEVPMFKLVMLCNKMPKIDDAQDGGFLRRYKGINFPNRFIDGEPKNPNEFKADPNLKTKLKDNVEYRQQYMLIMLEYCARYIEKDEKIKIPDAIERYSRHLVQQYDVFTEFLETCMETTGDKNDVLSAKDMYDEFKCYYREYQGGGGKLPISTQSEFVEKMKKCLIGTAVEYKSNLYGSDSKRIGKGFSGIKICEMD